MSSENSGRVIETKADVDSIAVAAVSAAVSAAIEKVVLAPPPAVFREYSPLSNGFNTSEPPAPIQSSCKNHGQLDKANEGQVVYLGEVNNGSTVWFTGRRHPADVQVVERSASLYQLIFSVTMNLGIERYGDSGACDSNFTAGGQVGGLTEKATASLSLRESDIRAMLSRWLRLIAEGGNALSWETRANRGAMTDSALKKWMLGGRAPQRAHLLQWLLSRLEIVEQEAEPTEALAGKGLPRTNGKWRLRIGHLAEEQCVNSAGKLDGAHHSGKINTNSPHDMQVGGNNYLRVSSECDSSSSGIPNQREDGNFGSDPIIGISVSNGMREPPPPYEETLLNFTPASPPPYDEVMRGTCPLVLEHETTRGQHGERPPKTVSPNPSFSSTDTLRGPPPSYRTPSESGEEEIRLSEGVSRKVTIANKHEEVPREASPPYRSLVDQVMGVGHGKTRAVSSRYWGRMDPTVYPSSNRLPMGEGKRACERERQRQRDRRRRLQEVGSTKIADQLGPKDELHSSAWVKSGRRIRTAGDMTRASGIRTLGQRSEASRSDQRGAKGTDKGERWRLTAYMTSCKKEVAEAEERRRKAEAAVIAAERSAWSSKQSKDEDDEQTSRTRARAATREVLDLTLVAERVRKEELRRRVSFARAQEEMTWRKQPFRERRGRHMRGASLGPPMGPTEPIEPQRDPRLENATRKFYWDEHGRRYSRVEEGIPRESASGELVLAMNTIRRTADAYRVDGLDFREPFRALDADGDGYLTMAELGAALRRAGVQLRLSQVTALFRHFDSSGSDLVSRGEFLWEFIDKERLLAQWREAGTARGERWDRDRNEIQSQDRATTFRHRDRAAPFRDRTRARRGNLITRLGFSRALAEVPLTIDGWEEQVLMDRFQITVDGEIDWHEFVSWMSAAEEAQDKEGSEGRDNWKRLTGSSPRSPIGHKPERRASAGHRESWSASGGIRWEDYRDSNPHADTGKRPVPRSHRRNLVPQVARSREGPSSRDGQTTMTRAKGRGLWNSEISTSNLLGANRRSPTRPRTPSEARGAGGMTQRRDEKVLDNGSAIRVLDKLIQDQRDIEVFLEEELARRGADAGNDVSIRR